MRATMLRVCGAVSMAAACLLAGRPTELPNAAAAEPPFIAPTDPRTPAEEKKLIHLPPGFEIQLVACEPDIHKPMNMNFDDRGRLWITDTIEYPFPVPEGKAGRDTVKILEDFGEDGRARKITTFAEGLNIPIGILPLPTAPGEAGPSCLVHSIPSIWKFTDSTGAGKADKREVLMSTYGSRDTHGMTNSFTLGCDGWVYACHGFSNTSTVKAKDGSQITMNSGNTYRFRPDGSRVEQWTWGQVNPFGLCFDDLGNLYSADCHSRPLYQLLRGAYYPSFGKPHDGLGFGPEMCNHDHGSTAIAGIQVVASDHFPAEYRGTYFVGNVVTCRINHDKITKTGSTVRATAIPDFLSSDDPWFRPVDMKFGPDGALYVADFYNRIIGHYEVPLTHPGRDRERGRIWRIIYRGKDGQAPAPKFARADFTKATSAELAADLANPNLMVRMTAMQQLVTRGAAGAEAAKAAMGPKSDPHQRMHGLWVLHRTGALDAATLETAAKDVEAGVRVHAMRVLSETPNLTEAQTALLHAGLKDADADVRRNAADALGMHPAAANVKPLLDARHAAGNDAQLVHTIRMALRNQLSDGARWEAAVKGLSEAGDLETVADVALAVPSPQSAAFLLARWKTGAVRSPADAAKLVRHIVRYGTAGDAQALAQEFAGKMGSMPVAAGLDYFKSYRQGVQERGGPLNAEAQAWAAALTDKLLASPDPKLVAGGAELAGSLKLASAQPKLAALAADHKAAEALRKAAIAGLAALNPAESVSQLTKILADPSEPAGLRESVAAALGGINQPAARTELIAALKTAPDKLQSAIAVGLAASPAGAEALLTAVAEGKASARLLQEKPVQVKLGASGAKDVNARIASLTKGLPPADAKINALIKARQAAFAKAAADPAKGAEVFTKFCAACHQIGGKGAKVGPQLDGVGIRGLDRLLEDVLDPNRNVDQAFRTTQLALSDGTIVSGLVLREEGQVIVLADQQGKEVRVEKSNVEKRVVQPLSPMPANLSDQIPEADFHHLMAYLLSQRAAPPEQPK